MPRQLPIGGRIAASDISLGLDRALSARIGLAEMPVRILAGRTTGMELYEDVTRTTSITTSWMDVVSANTGNLVAGDMLYIYGGGVAHWYRWTYTSADNKLVLNDTSPPTSIAAAAGTFLSGISGFRTTSGLTAYNTSNSTDYVTSWDWGGVDKPNPQSRTTTRTTTTTTSNLTSWDTAQLAESKTTSQVVSFSTSQTTVFANYNQSTSRTTTGNYGGDKAPYSYTTSWTTNWSSSRTTNWLTSKTTYWTTGNLGFRINDGQSVTWEFTGQDLGTYSGTFRFTQGQQVNISVFDVRTFTVYADGSFRVFGGGFGNSSFRITINDNGNQRTSALTRTTNLFYTTSWSTITYDPDALVKPRIAYSDLYGKASFLMFPTEKTLRGPYFMGQDYGLAGYVQYNARRIFSGQPMSRTTSWEVTANYDATTSWTTSHTTSKVTSWTTRRTTRYGYYNSADGGDIVSTSRTTSYTASRTTSWLTSYTTSAIEPRTTTWTTSRITNWITYPSTTVQVPMSRTTSVTGPKAMSRTTSWTTSAPMSRSTQATTTWTESWTTWWGTGGGNNNRTTSVVRSRTTTRTTNWTSYWTTSLVTNWITQHTTSYTTSWTTTKTTSLAKAIIEFNASFTGDWTILNAPLYGDIALGVNTEGQVCETTTHTITAYRGCKNGNSQTKTIVYRLNAMRNNTYETLKIGYTYTQAVC